MISYLRLILLSIIFLVCSFNAVYPYEYIPGELLIKLKQPTEQKIHALAQLYNAKIEKTLSLLSGDIYVLKLDERSNMLSFAKAFAKHEDVAFAEPNYIFKTIETSSNRRSNLLPYIPNDPEFVNSWGFINNGDNDPYGLPGVMGADINIQKAWDITRGSKNIKIAVIDTGIDYNHVDLKNNIWTNKAELKGALGKDNDHNGFVDDIHGYDFANDDNDPIDDNGHGTHCAGIIGAIHNNNEGLAGVMSNVSLIPIKFLDRYGSGELENAVRAVDYATRLGVHIMSNSWGGGPYTQALFEAIQYAERRGILFVAAAGNENNNNDDSEHYPSNYQIDNIISVASHDNDDNLSEFTNYGAKTVDVAAPGNNIFSTYRDGRYEILSGTSMAAPFVSGALGLLISHIGTLSPLEVKNRLHRTSQFVMTYKNKIASNGRLNVYNLLNNINASTPVDPSEGDWVKVPLSEVFETPHPYPPRLLLKRTITIPNAKMIRARFSQFKTELNNDNLHIFGKDGILLDSLSGIKEGEITSAIVGGNTIELKFFSNSFVNDWGFLLSEVEVIY